MVFFELVTKKLEEYTKLQQYPQDEEKKYRQAILEVFTNLNTNGFLDINEKDEDGETILMSLAWAGSISHVKFLVEAGADVNAIDEGYNFALYNAARQGWEEVFDYLALLTFPELREIAEKALPNGIIYRKRKNNNVVEAFVDAAFFGNTDVIYTSIYQGIDINAISSNGEAALHKAIRNNQLSVVRILLEAGANPNLKIEGDWEYSPLMIALSLASIDNAIFQALLEAGANLNDTSSRGESVIFIAASTFNVEAVRHLIELKADVNAKDINGHTVLYYAMRCKYKTKEMEEIIQILKAAGAKED